VLDNLIVRREIPVMLAVFINPGRTPEQPEPTPQNWGDRDTNRPTEYNSLDDRYARVIVDELLPALQKDFNISKDPERRAIGGASSGAIAAFTVAWERPDAFRKVLSIVGSFVNLRGGHRYPDLVLEAEKKPIRVFLQDGRNDNRALRADGTYDQTRDWFYQNVRLMEAGGLLAIDISAYGSLKMTERGAAALAGDGEFQLRMDMLAPPKGAGRKDRGKTQPLEPLTDGDQGLLGHLKHLRMTLARERGVPAYVIFTDRSLHDMAQRKPASLDEFASVHGVGQAKLREFASLFLDAIQSQRAA
jgi:hypothetical protein